MVKFRQFSAASVIVIAGLLTTSCAGQPTAAPSSFSVEPAGAGATSASASSSPAPSRKENDRGQLVKDIGEVAGISSDQNPDENWVQFKVTDIKEATCDSGYSEKPEKGNYLLQVDLEVETKKVMRDVLEELGGTPEIWFDAGWDAYASNGTTMNSTGTDAAFSCLSEAARIPSMIGPAEKATGSVVLEVSDPVGEIAYSNYMVDSGWAWEYDLTETK